MTMTDPHQFDDLTEKANAAFRQAAAKVVQQARLSGTPVIVWQDGQIKAIPPEQLKHLEIVPDRPEKR